jgi:hypothetical protein
MKTVIKLTIVLLFITVGVKAQNLQTHYDFDRGHITSTLEMFKPDAYGNTSFFVDMDYNKDINDGVSLSYFEIARVFKTDKMPIGIHAEFNAGQFNLGTDNNNVGLPINRAYLAGVDYSYNAADYSKGFTIKALYKYIVGKHDATFQFTAVYYWHMFNRKLTLIGFADFWKEDNVVFDEDGNAVDTKYVFLAEPQLWYNINDNFGVGGEIELSNNFAGVEGFKVRPTLGVKWTF